MSRFRLVSYACLLQCSFVLAFVGATHRPAAAENCPTLFARDNLVAWCIVPFDSRRRTPEERAEMLARLGFRRFAYDWRAEHLPTLDREIKALAERHISLDAVWFPAALNDDAKILLDALRRHAIHTQLWVTMGDPAPDRDGEAKLATAVAAIKPIAEEADRIGCEVALYNHGGWFGEPENQLAILDKLGMSNVGIVYNLHHAHDQLDRFPALLKKMLPHLLALNLNGMARDGDRVGKKILPLGQGEVDLPLLRTIFASGYLGPIGILGHTQDDAEARLRDNLDGLDWLTPQLGGAVAAAKPIPRTPVGEGPPAPAGQFVGRIAAGKPEYRQPPLTVECRVKLPSRDTYNILVASNPKSSGTHWEVFTMPGSGALTAYLPGMKPDHVRSENNLCDGAWHDVAMIYEARRVRLLLDGMVVADQPVEPAGKASVPGGLAVGRLVEGGLGCQGDLAYVRLSRGAREPVHRGAAPPAADETTTGLWLFDNSPRGDVPDQSSFKNAAKVAAAVATEQGPVPPPGVHCQSVDGQFTAELVDRSARDVYLGVKVDSEGRVFVGAREAVYRFEPYGSRAFSSRQVVCRLPADSIVMGLEFRGDDLYVLTNNALYLLPQGRVEPAVTPRRILWGLPLDLHVSFHCLAWGPEGDLYVTHGDPLLNYGDWNHPDHWGHWTLYAGPDGKPTPYTGMGAVLRLRPDGRFVQVVAGGLRGPVGLAFDPQWNLFTNDNDHESRADLYAPARLLHVTPHIDFAWPRGWIASKSPSRFDLVEPLTADLGRGVPCDLAWHDGALLMARWDRMTLNRYPLDARGASFSAQEQPFLKGSDFARPVGTAVGLDGRIFVTCLYLGGNVGSPHCYSDLVMLCDSNTEGENRSSGCDLIHAPADKLWQELSEPRWQRRAQAHQEILRRGGKLLDEAVERLTTRDGVNCHLPWLAAASGSADARRLLITQARHRSADIRLQAIRVLAESPRLKAPDELFVSALGDAEPAIQLAALGALFSRQGPLPIDAIARLAASNDTYLRQTAAKLLARRATIEELAKLMQSETAAMRRAAVLAAGFRLTVPSNDYVPPESLPLTYSSGNAAFTLRFADADQPVDLRARGRVGSFTTAEWWKSAANADECRPMYEHLLTALDDSNGEVVQQAAYFLSLLNDTHAEPRIADARRRVLAEQALHFAPKSVDRLWSLGPIADPTFLLEKVAPPDRGPVDLAASYATASGKCAWRQTETPNGLIRAADKGEPSATTRTYLSFQLQSIARRAAMIEVEGVDKAFIWHNGQAVSVTDRGAAIELQGGGNDLLVRIDRSAGQEATLGFRADESVIATLPDKVDFALLAERLKQAGKGADQVPAELLSADWSNAADLGDAQQGRRLFGSLGCTKCHGVTIEQSGGGAPNLADVRRRFTTAYVVESILLPSKQVADPFRGTTLALADGRTISGLVVSDGEQQLELLLPDATRLRIAKSDIEERLPSAVSPMPSGLVKTPQELRDLLAYLLSERPTPP
jgi:putative heme-binding domain-containing protein